MTNVIDESADTLVWRMMQGDAWPDEPVEFQVTEEDGTTAVAGYVTSARLQVRASYDAPNPLASLTSEPGGGLTVSADGSSVTLAEGAVPDTTDWPAVDPDLRERAQTPCVFDLEVTKASGWPDTLAAGVIYVRPQVTR